MNIEKFQQQNKETRITYTCVHEPIASREMPPRWFYIVYKVDDFFVEMKFDEFGKDRLAVEARAIKPELYKHHVKNNYYFIHNTQVK